MAIDLTLVSGDLVLSGIFAFLASMATVAIYFKLKATFEERRYKADDTIIEAVVLEYTRRLRDYDKAIADLRTKFDVIEARGQPHVVMSQQQQPSHPRPHVAHMTEPVTVTQHAAIESEGNGTTDYILKLLLDRPRTSREVQQAIGRTREHTSRLMKKLHDFGLVSRDINTKPFRYNITDAGRESLKGRAETASIAV
ncbi:MAG TPA: helix-turn-helix domain-containing protein [Nitrososphaera sp.]